MSSFATVNPLEVPTRYSPFACRLSPVAFRLSLLAIALAVLGCEDPPPAGGESALLVAIKLDLPSEHERILSGGQGETLEGLESLVVEVSRVDVVHRTVEDDPDTERVITVFDEPQTIQLAGRLQDAVSKQIAFINVPVGYVQQVRFIVEKLTIRVSGETYDVKLPSGLKVEPTDTAFEIRDNERTAIQIGYNPFDSLIRNKGVGFMHKPVVTAVEVDLRQISPIILDQVLIKMPDEATFADAEALAADGGYEIINYDPGKNFYSLRLPANKELKNAVVELDERSDVQLVVPDTQVAFMRNDCANSSQTNAQHDQVGIREAWDALSPHPIGSQHVVVAVVDTGFVLNQIGHIAESQLLYNYWVNQAELRGWLVFDVDDDGVMTQEELVSFDTNGDGLVNFIDLNAESNHGLCDPAAPDGELTCDLDGNGWVDPLDLVSGERYRKANADAECAKVDDGAFVGAENATDEDGNGRCDDLVGWDMRDQDNNPFSPPRLTSCQAAHGNAVARIIGSSRSCDDGLDLFPDGGERTLGVSHRVSIMPVQIDTYLPTGAGGPLDPDLIVSTHSSAVLGIRYAADSGADVINASFGQVYAAGKRSCHGGVLNPDLEKIDDIGNDKFDELAKQLRREAVHLGLNGTVLVTAAGNCGMNLDASRVFGWPGELGAVDHEDAPAVINVGGVDAEGVASDLSNFGPKAVSIAAPFSVSISIADSSTDTSCEGTSVSAPLVSGTLALLLAAQPALIGDAFRLMSCVAETGSRTEALEGAFSGGLLNAHEVILCQ